MLNKMLSISFMSNPEMCFLCIPSGPEAVSCEVLFRRSLISRAVIAWNTSLISKALWYEPMTVKGIVIFGFVPTMPCRRISHPLAWGSLNLHPLATVYLHWFAWSLCSDSYERVLDSEAYLYLFRFHVRPAWFLCPFALFVCLPMWPTMPQSATICV